MFAYENKKVVKAVPSGLKPKTAITIAVDTAYVASQGGSNISKGIYMMDNMEANGSTGEGTLELKTVCNVGSLIGFEVIPVNILGDSGDTVEITGFTVSQGSVFTAAGKPVQQKPDYWIGQAMAAGNQTYQIQIKVTKGRLHPVIYYINWDPFITAK
jgi:hypothetical protein